MGRQDAVARASLGEPTCVRIGLDRALERWLPEVRYAVDAILAIAGYSSDWGWADRPEPYELGYGPAAAAATIAVPWCGCGFDEVAAHEPSHSGQAQGRPEVGFRDAPLPDAADWIYGAFWFLSGAREPQYPRDHVDNISLEGTFLKALQGRPWVSIWAALLRTELEAAGLPATRPAWGESALAITHDVDYPEIVRLVELLRRPRDAAAILCERDPFWCFNDWATFSEQLGTHSAFYFMARQGSLVRYLSGDPDAFYDVSSARYRAVLAELVGRGCEIGLHASFRSSEEPLRYAAEKAKVEEAAGVEILGNRQHYWRLDPVAPHESLSHLAEAGFRYDSSLAFERLPGFRRGTCHPFRPWHPGRREAIDLVEVPPAWMDDHYDGRMADAGIEEAEAHARTLLEDVAATGGVAVVDYHVRGMNERFFPRWGAWLAGFLPEARPIGMVGRTPAQIAEEWQVHTERLAAASRQEMGPAE